MAKSARRQSAQWTGCTAHRHVRLCCAQSSTADTIPKLTVSYTLGPLGSRRSDELDPDTGTAQHVDPHVRGERRSSSTLHSSTACHRSFPSQSRGLDASWALAHASSDPRHAALTLTLYRGRPAECHSATRAATTSPRDPPRRAAPLHQQKRERRGGTPSGAEPPSSPPASSPPLSPISSSLSHPTHHLTMHSPNAPICDDGGESLPRRAKAEPCAPTYVDSNGVWCCLWCGRAYAC
jgi:hypothetical protein